MSAEPKNAGRSTSRTARRSWCRPSRALRAAGRPVPTSSGRRWTAATGTRGARGAGHRARAHHRGRPGPRHHAAGRRQQRLAQRRPHDRRARLHHLPRLPAQPRVTNIHRIADIVRGTVVLPGETFSVNDVVGPAHRRQGVRGGRRHPRRRARRRGRRRRVAVRHDDVQRRLLRRPRHPRLPGPQRVLLPLPRRSRGHDGLPEPRPAVHEQHALRHPDLDVVHRHQPHGDPVLDALRHRRADGDQRVDVRQLPDRHDDAHPHLPRRAHRERHLPGDVPPRATWAATANRSTRRDPGSVASDALRRRGRRRRRPRRRRGGHRPSPAPGRDVVVVDKARFPATRSAATGSRPARCACSRTSASTRRRCPRGSVVDDVVVRGPSGHEVTFPLPRGRGTYAAVARRTDLDAALVDVARAAGAKVLDGHACTGAVEGDDERHGLGRGRGRACPPASLVAADGMWSPVRKHLGLATPGYRGEWHAFRQYFTDVGPAGRVRADRVVRARPAARLRLVVPPAGRPGQRRLRHPAGRQGRPGPGHGRHLARPPGPAPRPGRARRRRRARVAPPGLAHPGPHRRGGAHRAAHAVRRRRRHRHRSAHRRGHRPGAADRGAGGRGHRWTTGRTRRR